MISRETDFTKQESSTSDTAQTFHSGSSTTSWSRLKDPRIVRVSRAFGGKDRHSKVCTVRGLRDRRVRLSVPTAIQLYDLQDRLGLNQPSKVVDWLLNAAKNEIDELPPLHFPQGCLLPMLNISHSDKQGLSGKSKDVSAERGENWGRQSDEGREFYLGINQENAYVSAQENPSSLVSSLMNSSSIPIPINSFVRWDPSNLSLSQSQPPINPGSSPHHHEDWHNFSLVYQPSGMIAQPYFNSQISASNGEFDTKNLNFQSSQVSSSSSLPSRPIHFNMTANLLPSQNNDGS